MKKLLPILLISFASCTDKVQSISLKPQPPKLVTDTLYFKTISKDGKFIDIEISKKEFIKLKKDFE